MPDYPILEEIANFFIDNLEVLLLVITPIALIVTYIGKKIYERIHSVEQQADKLLRDQKDELNARMDHIEKELDKFDETFKKDTQRTSNAITYVNEKHDNLYKEFKAVQLDIVSELKVIRVLLNDKTVVPVAEDRDSNSGNGSTESI